MIDSVFVDQHDCAWIPTSTSRRRRFSIFAFAAAILCTTEVFAQSTALLPQPVPLPPTVEVPRDTPYPGTIQLHVDATDVLRRIYQIHERVPVATPGPLTLLYPQWTPGDHAPNEPLEKLAGLIVIANGTRLHWLRDTVDPHAFHIEVPTGVQAIDLHYQYLGGVGPITGPILITSTMLDLQWQSLILYPAGHFSRDIRYRPFVTLPADWTYLTSLDGGAPDPHGTGNTVVFPSLALDDLIDQPIMAGRYLKQVVLTEDPVPVRLDVAAQSADDFTALPAAAKRFAAITPAAYKLFGSHHYDHYDHMLFLSDELSTYFEHHRSGENSTSANYLRVTSKSADDVPDLSFLVHGYVHSWNGMYRRPAEMWASNLNTPERDSMLWVFEGLTEYWQTVLSFRAGFSPQSEIAEDFSGLAALMTLDAGADWRSLDDTNNDPIFVGRKTVVWGSWQRNMFDPYLQGEMIWLEADAIIRQQSAGQRSLDDFARSFFGGDDGGNITKTYTFEGMVRALNAVQPYDWHSFLRSHLDDYGQGQLAHSIERAGYQLVFTDKPSGDESASKALDLAYSLGMRVNATGTISAIHWGGPAFKANLSYGQIILTVNGKPYDPALFRQAIVDAAKGGPLDLVVERNGWRMSTSIEWRGGMRYPHLQRIPGKPALLDDILAPSPK